MAVTWLQPVVWWGLALLALPIAIHLLARQQSRRVLFPTLRFLNAAPVAAMRRRAISHWPLLIVRLLILAAAVAALAGPVAVSSERQAAWSRRVARAVVIAGSKMRTAPTASPAVTTLVADERERAFASEVFTAAVAADAIVEAEAWLGRQPPAARELVIAGDLREGGLSASDLDVVPAHVGIRFLPDVARDSADRILLRGSEDVSGRPAAYEIEVQPLSRLTTARYRALGPENLGVPIGPGGADQPSLKVRPSAGALANSEDHALRSGAGDMASPIGVVAAASDQAAADAVLRAVLREGVMFGRHTDRHVVVAFAGSFEARADSLSLPDAPWMRATLEALVSDEGATAPAPPLRGGIARVRPNRGGAGGGALVVVAPYAVSDPRSVELVARVANAAFADSLIESEPRRLAAATLAAWSRPMGPPPADARPGDEGDRRWLWATALGLLLLERWMRVRPARGSLSAEKLEEEVEARVA